jgi:hypothetical protein
LAVSRAWWLERGEIRVRIDSGGLLFGRALTCHVVLDDARASKRHALVRLGLEGPELLPLGRNPTSVNGAAAHRPTILRPGDRLELPGGAYTVRVEGDRAPAPGGATLMCETDDGWLFAPHDPDFTVGSDRLDSLHVASWPPGALRVQSLHQSFVATLGAPLRVNGVEQPEGALIPLKHHTRFEGDGFALSLFQESQGGAQTTHLIQEDPFAERLRLIFLPKGGRFEAHFSNQPPLAVGLSELRCRFMAILMLGREGYTPGEFLEDEDAISGVWPRADDKTNHDVNTLVYRIRNSLLAKGIDPFLVMERSKAGAGTRLRVGPDTAVEVE